MSQLTRSIGMPLGLFIVLLGRKGFKALMYQGMGHSQPKYAQFRNGAKRVRVAQLIYAEIGERVTSVDLESPRRPGSDLILDATDRPCARASKSPSATTSSITCRSRVRARSFRTGPATGGDVRGAFGMMHVWQ
jgi:hypothetical protein